MTFFYFHTLICLPDELPPQSDVPMCIYYLPSLLILSFYIILLLQQFQKLFFRKRLGKIIALNHLDSPAADLFHFFLCFHPFGNNMIIHFTRLLPKVSETDISKEAEILNSFIGLTSLSRVVLVGLNKHFEKSTSSILIAIIILCKTKILKQK